MKNIAVITARGGSKRIPQKNIKEFCGQPILLYSVFAARESGVFDEVMVSTDSEEIAQIARQAGANVPFMRSAKTANDFATTADVLLEVIQCYEKNGSTFDTVCCLYPTAPFVTGEKLKEAEVYLRTTEAESVMPVVQFSFPPQRALIKNDDYVTYEYPQYSTTRSQDLTPLYHDCGQFYFCRTEALKKYKSLVTPRTMPLIVPETEVQDIDNLSDWKIAEMKYRQMVEELSQQ